MADQPKNEVNYDAILKDLGFDPSDFKIIDLKEEP